jgi:hypothetical protein
MTRRTPVVLPLVAAALLAACGTGETLDPSVEKLGRATGPVAPVAQPAPADGAARPAEDGAPTVHAGAVLERIHVPNYTYLRLGLADGREAWAAIPRTEIEVGAKARVVESLVMRKFTSPSLGRTFETIVFGTLEGAAAAGRAADAGPAEPRPSGPLPPGHPPI